jgi:hypothetical protein
MAGYLKSALADLSNSFVPAIFFFVITGPHRPARLSERLTFA